MGMMLVFKSESTNIQPVMEEATQGTKGEAVMVGVYDGKLCEGVMVKVGTMARVGTVLMVGEKDGGGRLGAVVLTGGLMTMGKP